MIKNLESRISYFITITNSVTYGHVFFILVGIVVEPATEKNASENVSDFILDFGKLLFPPHLGKYVIKIGKISTKIHEIGKIKAIFSNYVTCASCIFCA